jgi:hypothetical protein
MTPGGASSLSDAEVQRRFRNVRRGLRRHDARWVVACRARSIARRFASIDTLIAVGYCGAFFGGPLPPQGEAVEAKMVRSR